MPILLTPDGTSQSSFEQTGGLVSMGIYAKKAPMQAMARRIDELGGAGAATVQEAKRQAREETMAMLAGQAGAANAAGIAWKRDAEEGPTQKKRR